jgi:tRNA 2-thiouridine synthesizing protein E
MQSLIIEYGGIPVEVNEEGFLMHPDQWTPDVAEAIAAEVGISPLTEQHWKVITFCREDAQREGQPPGLRRISKLSGVGMKELYQLFPKGPGKLASRVSGLPKPQGCV